MSTLIAAAISVLPVSDRPLAAQDARELHLETFIYVGRDKAISENLTLFAGGKVYDFRRDPNTHETIEVAIYDPARQRFELFDIVGRRRMSIQEADILDLLSKVATNPEVTRRDPMLFDQGQIGAMKETYDASTGWVTLTTADGRLGYRAHGQAPRNPDVLVPYYQFVDWYSRLNGTDPGKMPPFARLQLNKVLLRYGLLPDEIELSYSPPGLLDRRINVSSKHFINWGLLPADRELIEKKIPQWAEFPHTDVATYFTADDSVRR